MHTNPRGASPTPDATATAANENRPRSAAGRSRPSVVPGTDRSVDGRPDAATTIAEEVLVVVVVAAAWFAIGAGAALALVGQEAAIVDMAVSLAVAVAGTICTLALFARLSTREG